MQLIVRGENPVDRNRPRNDTDEKLIQLKARENTEYIK
jgi:hypothetical protein